MGNEAHPRGNRLPLRWIAVTSAGWLVGVVLVVLLSMAWDLVGGGAQFMVGVGMGVVVGLLQSRMIASWVTSGWHWFLASTIGMGIPYLLWDLGVGFGVSGLLAMWVCTVVGGVLVGVLQRPLFRAPRPRAGLWVVACAFGWSVPEWLLQLSNMGLLPGKWDLLSIAGVLFGGVLLGSVTSLALPRRLSRSAV